MSPAKSNFLVIFDLDNTLIVNQPAAKDAYKNAINYLAKQHGIYNDRYKLYNHWKKIVQQLKTSSDPSKRQFEYSLRQLLQAQKIPDTYISQSLAVYQKDFLEKIQPQAGAGELLQWIKKGTASIAVATESTTAMAKKKLKSVHLKSFVDILISSNHTGTMKPNPTYFQLAIQESGVKKNHTIVVGDSEVRDLEPAREIGLHTIKIPSRKFNLGEIKPQLQTFFETS